jgi:hypothetical protein
MINFILEDCWSSNCHLQRTFLKQFEPIETHQILQNPPNLLQILQTLLETLQPSADTSIVPASGQPPSSQEGSSIPAPLFRVATESRTALSAPSPSHPSDAGASQDCVVFFRQMALSFQLFFNRKLSVDKTSPSVHFRFEKPQKQLKRD